MDLDGFKIRALFLRSICLLGVKISRTDTFLSNTGAVLDLCP